MSNRRSGGFNNNNNRRYFDNHGGGGGGGRVMQNQNRGSMGNMNHGGGQQQGGGWRQGGQNQNRRTHSIGPQGGGGMNTFDNRQFQHHQQQQQQQMMNHQQNQFQNQLSNAVLRNSVGPNPGMMSSFGGNQDQALVMVVPQSQATGGMMGGNMNNMGMVQSQNPFAAAVMNQQKPMPVIIGNLPAGLNPAAFGQQVLPAYGQGVGEQNMGMFGQQTQQGSNRFGRDNKNSSDRGRIQRNQKVALVRRTDVNDRGRITTPRGVAKKRVIPVREQYGDNKKPKTVAGIARNRVALPIRKGIKTRRINKNAAGNKAAAKNDKPKEAVKATPNGNAKAATEGEVKPAGEATEAAAPEENKPSKYEEVPVELLVCRVCKKTSPDAKAFDTHLTSKVHVNLMKILEEKFTKRAELLMYESKMCEDEIAVEMDRPRRAGKGPHGGKGNKHHCKMCDCNYTVNWGTHKQSVWHRTLKEFLHPNCRFCKSQFVHRRDWIEHILSVAHMKKLLELKQEGQLSAADLESTSQEELFAVHIEVTKDEKPLNIVNFHSLGGRQPLTDDVKAMLAGEKGEIVLPEGEIKVPEQYDENVAVGEDAVFLVGGSCCKVCRIYIQAGEQDHCKSRQHFDSYVEYLKRVIKLREQKAADELKAKEEAEQKAKAEAEAAAKAAEEAVKAAEAAKKAETAAAESAEKKEAEAKAASASPAKTAKSEQMEVEADTAQKPDEVAVVEEADGAEVEKMEEDQPAAEVATTPAKPAPTTPKTTPQRGGQNNRGARGSPARGGRGGPNRGGGFPRGGRGGQQQQTPARGTTPRVDSNMRGGRGGQARGGNRGGARGSPGGRGRGRGGW